MMRKAFGPILVRSGVAIVAVPLAVLSSLVAGTFTWGVLLIAGHSSIAMVVGLMLVAAGWVTGLATALRGVEWLLSRGLVRGSAWPAAFGSVTGLFAGTLLRRAVFGVATDAGYPSHTYALLNLVALASSLAAVFLAAWAIGDTRRDQAMRNDSRSAPGQPQANCRALTRDRH
jgi:hypothetical protein